MRGGRGIRPYRVHMGVEGVGSSVVIALAAVLWLVYLIPTWLRRREYLTTERNAVRLQQTIRILAETAETPSAVRLEADARTVAQQEKLVRQQFERDRAVAEAKQAAMNRAAARTLAALQPSVASEAMLFSRAAIRLRRSRAVTSAVLLVALAGVGLSFVPMLASVSGVMLGAASGVALAALLMLHRLASVARARTKVVRELRSRPTPARRPVLIEEPVDVAPLRESAWTPVPLPKPLYLQKPAPQPVVSAAMLAEARDRLLDEAAASEAAEREEKVTVLRPTAETQSAWALMGIVDAADAAPADLDAALRRRRAV